MADGNYEFQVKETNRDVTTYTLTVTNLPACNFKISNGSGKYGHLQDVDGRIHHNHNGINGGNLYTRPYNDGEDFVLQSAGTTTFTFKYDGGDPYELQVYREPKLYIKGDFNNWTEEAMTQTSTGWTISKTINKEQKFRFIDEFGQWHADESTGDNYWITSIDDPITIKPGFDNRKDFIMKTDGGYYIINVNSAITQMVIYDNSNPESKSLAQLESTGGGVVGKPYTINEPLQVVFYNTDKEFGIARNTTADTVSCPQGYKDFMRYSVTNVNDKQPGSWKQNNWVMLDFRGANKPQGLVNGTVIITSLKGVYTDNNNYTIKVDPNVTLSVTTGDAYEPNVYCPANFYGNTHTQTVQIPSTGNSVTYWFMTPQPMEYCKFTYAMYYAGTYNNVNYAPGFYMQNGDAVALKGGVGFDMSYNSANPELVNGQSYRFNGVIMQTGQRSGAKDNYPQDPDINSSYKVAALNLTKGEGQVITAVNEVKSGSEVVSVTYCDLAGRMSQKPFAGVNIIVTRYSDGTTTTQKVIR